jgi:hypothetical protein
MTKRLLKRESSVMMSSVMPSAKYSCSGSLLMFTNGKTAMAGFSAVTLGVTTATAGVPATR